jgi:hypothetical protein
VATIATATSAKTQIKARVEARVVSHATSAPTAASKPSSVASSLSRHWLAHVNYLGKGTPMFFGGRWRLIRGDTTAASGASTGKQGNQTLGGLKKFSLA